MTTDNEHDVPNVNQEGNCPHLQGQMKKTMTMITTTANEQNNPNLNKN